ncbi:ABC transporter permease [candidate division KSB1 bacterium]|nr:ABC transporter permease [candidate division KSB1 bacterium]
MFKSYLTIAVRNISRFKAHSAINILGLSMSLAVVLLLFFHVKTEISADRFHKNYLHIYRFQEENRANLSPQFKEIIQENFPEIEKVTRILSGFSQVILEYNQPLYVKKIYFTDTSFFDIFTCEVVAGDLKTALNEPASLVLIDREATRLFGNEHPIGKIVKLNKEHLLKITAVIKPLPENSSLTFSGVIPIQFLSQVEGSDWEQISSTNFSHYFLSHQKIECSELAAKIKKYFNQIYPGYHLNRQYQILPFKQIYFNQTTRDSCRHGNRTQLLLLTGISLLILVIAIINFINLAIAKSARRMLEIGIRKFAGASRFQLICQFLSEAMLISLFSVGLALVLAEILSPYFNDLFNTAVFVEPMNWPLLIFILIISGISLGCIAGIYPAFYLTAQRPSRIIKGERVFGTRTGNLKTGLLIFQFVVSIGLIICTLVIARQRSFMLHHDLGFNPEKIISLGYSDQIPIALQQTLLQIPNVEQLTIAGNAPGLGYSSSDMNWTYKGIEKQIYFLHNHVDAEFLPLMNFNLKEGRFFSKELDSTNPVCILNETAIKEFGIDDLSSAKFTTYQMRESSLPAQVIGVVKDFNHESLRSAIAPFIFFYEPNPESGLIILKIKSSNFETLRRTIANLETVWKKFNPAIPFSCQFFDEWLENQYRTDARFGKIFMAFSFLAILIACLGLLGLVSFLMEQRTKEIGIRKVLGATVTGIVGLLTRDYIRWIAFANLVAYPIAWYAMNKWLQNYAYRIEINWWIFALASGLAVGIALVTISWQAIRAATANPVESLRYE